MQEERLVSSPHCPCHYLTVWLQADLNHGHLALLLGLVLLHLCLLQKHFAFVPRVIAIPNMLRDLCLVDAALLSCNCTCDAVFIIHAHVDLCIYKTRFWHCDSFANCVCCYIACLHCTGISAEARLQLCSAGAIVRTDTAVYATAELPFLQLRQSPRRLTQLLRDSNPTSGQVGIAIAINSLLPAREHDLLHANAFANLYLFRNRI